MRTPIAFIFNDGYAFPASICIYSLLVNARKDTFYNIYILFLEERLSKENIEIIEKMKEVFNNVDFHFISVENKFQNFRTVRYITIDAYVKFLIPELLKDLDKVIYVDADIIFDSDISELAILDFNESIAAVRIPVGNISKKYLKSININPENYFNSGVIIMNLRKIRQEDIVNKKILPLIGTKFDHVDQDIFNIAFQKDTFYISSIYNYSADRIFNDIETHLPTDNIAIYHYTGQKPWREIVPFGDIWWEYYRKSIYFDKNSYNSYQKKVINTQKYIKLGKLFDKYKIFSFVSFFKKLFK